MEIPGYVVVNFKKEKPTRMRRFKNDLFARKTDLKELRRGKLRPSH
jgi:hypothetical protein